MVRNLEFLELSHTPTISSHEPPLVYIKRSIYKAVIYFSYPQFHTIINDINNFSKYISLIEIDN